MIYFSFGDEGGSTIFGDVQLLSIGYTIVFIFIFVVLGRFNAVEHKVLHSSTQAFACLLSVASSYLLSVLEMKAVALFSEMFSCSALVTQLSSLLYSLCSAGSIQCNTRY